MIKIQTVSDKLTWICKVLKKKMSECYTRNSGITMQCWINGFFMYEIQSIKLTSFILECGENVKVLVIKKMSFMTNNNNNN